MLIGDGDVVGLVGLMGRERGDKKDAF